VYRAGRAASCGLNGVKKSEIVEAKMVRQEVFMTRNRKA
jgi:hypothetical protein